MKSFRFLHWKILFRKLSWLLSFSYSISLPNFHLMRIIYFMFFLLHLLLSEITICNENFYVVNLIWYHKFTIIYIKIHTLTHKPQLLNINDHVVSSFYLQILSLHTTNIYVSCKQSKLKLYNNLSKNYKNSNGLDWKTIMWKNISL